MGDVAALTWPLTGPGGLLYNPSRIRRSLFGHVNHEKAQMHLEAHMDALMKQNKQRWNFDFENERPLPPGRYLWEKVEKPSDTDSNDTSVSQQKSETEEKSSSKGEQTLITDFMRKRKSSSKKDFVTTQPMKTRRRSST